MKGILLTIILLSSFCLPRVFAQAATEGTYEFARRENANGMSIIYQGQPENVKHVLEEWLEDASDERFSGFRGVRTLENVQISQFADNQYDYFLKVERAQRGDDEHARVILFVSAGNENFLNSSTNPQLFSRLEEWLESQQKEISMYELDLAIEAQQKVIEKARREYDRLQRDSTNLQATLTQTLASIEENKSDNQAQRETIASEEDRLQAFREELEAVRTGQEVILRTEEGVEREDELNEVIDLQEAPSSSSGGGNR